MSSLPIIFDVCSPARSQQMRVLRTRTTIDPSRESFGTCEKFLPLSIWQFFDNISCRTCNSGAACCSKVPSVATLTFSLPAVNLLFGCSSENPFKTEWRAGLSCSPIQLFHTAFDPRAWTMVVFWKENSGRQPQLIILENEGGDETNCPSPPPNSTFFDDPDVPFGPQGPPPPAPGPPEPPPGWPPAPSPAGDSERVRTGDTA